MGRRGTKPKSDERKRLEGTYRPDRAGNKQGVPTGVPAVPASLGDVARQHWFFLTNKLVEWDMVSEIDTALLEMMCDCYGMYISAKEQLKSEDIVVSNARGMKKPNPLIDIMNKEMDRYDKLSKRFGLGPADRMSLKLGKDEKKDDPFEELQRKYSG